MNAMLPIRPSGAVQVVAMPGVLPSSRRVEMTIAQGATIAEIVATALPGLPESERAGVRVMVGAVAYPTAQWGARPKAGTLVRLRVLPGNDAVRSALSILVMIAAIVIAPQLAGPFAAAFPALASVSTSLATAAVAFIGTAALNFLIPPAQNGNRKQSPTYSINGFRNVENPGGPVPQVLGSLRQAPPIAASSYTETVGDEQYLRFLLVFGYGPLDIQNIRIGDTPIDSFADVELELRSGYPDDEPVTLYPDQVIEEPLSIELRRDRPGSYPGATGAEDPQIRVTQADVTRIGIDLLMPEGLGYTHDEGNMTPSSVQFRIDYRALGDTDWTEQGDYVVGVASRKPVRRSYEWAVPVRGPRYEVRLTRTNYNWDDGRHRDVLQWTALRSRRPEYPVNFAHPVAVLAGRIRATKQLNGVLDSLSSDTAPIVPDWDAETETWITRPTRNPASIYRHVLQGAANLRPKPDSAIDLAGLADWHEFCAAKGLCYDRVHDFEAFVWDVLMDVTRAGRATPRFDGQRWGVVIDRPRTVVSGAITPRNAWGFEWGMGYDDPVDGFRCSFPDRTSGFETKERVVARPGFEGDPQRVEEHALPGVTDPDQVWRALMRRHLEIEHRPETFSAMQGLEQIETARGDLVLLNWFFLRNMQVASRVRAVSGSTVELEDEVTIAADGEYGIRFVRVTEEGRLSFIKQAIGAEGRTRVLALTGAGPAAAIGDTALFGPLGHEAEEVIVNQIERAPHFEGRVHCLAHAPQIDELLDAMEVPPWDGRVGPPAEEDDTPPAVPEIAVRSGREAYDGETYPPEGVPTILVTLAPGAGSVTVATYEVEHRLSGAPDWVAATVASATATIEGIYDIGDDVEIRARAISVAEVAGDWTTTVTHEVGGQDAAGSTDPDPVTDLAVSLVSGDPRIQWTNPNDTNFSYARVWRAASGSPFSSAGAVSPSRFGAPNAPMLYADASATSGDWDYWVTAHNSVHGYDGAAGPVTITVP